jgi:hypothetical protein
MSGDHDGMLMRLTLYTGALSAVWAWSGPITWGKAADLLLSQHDLSGPVPEPRADGRKPEDAAKLRCPCWSAVGWGEGATRRKAADVALVYALALDYDDGIGPIEALDRWAGYERLVYTSWSHSVAKPKCRIVMPLAEPIPGAIWSGVYREIIAAEGGQIDRQVIDPSRIWFGFAVGHGGPHYARRRGGALLSLVDLALAVDERQQAEAAQAEIDRAERASAARRARAEAERLSASGEDAAGRLRRRLFAVDVDLRLDVGLSTGGKVIDGPEGRMVRRARCPACARPSVWYGVEKGRARCDHIQSCGYGQPDGVRLIEYADAVGFYGGGGGR